MRSCSRELGGDALVQRGRRLGAVPGATIGIDARISGLGEGLVDAPPSLGCRRPVDRGAHQWMSEPHLPGPGRGAVQHLTRLMGRGRALEVLLTADDYDADLAERYGWINRALPADLLDGFVTALAHRIAAFPAAGQVAVKDRVNAISLAPIEEFRRDSDLFGAGVRTPETQHLIERAMTCGLQTRDGELHLATMLTQLSDGSHGSSPRH